MQKILRSALTQGQLMQFKATSLVAKQAGQSSFLMPTTFNFATLFNYNMRAFNTKIFVEGLPLDFTEGQL
jgi:hypothetical protein